MCKTRWVIQTSGYRVYEDEGSQRQAKTDRGIDGYETVVEWKTGPHCPRVSKNPVPYFFHPAQRAFSARIEWARGRQIEHPESSIRADMILNALGASDRFALRTPPRKATTELSLLHDPRLIRLYETAETLDPDEEYGAWVFLRNPSSSVDPGNLRHSGYFCFDSGTPLQKMTRTCAEWSAASALAAAECLVSKETPLAYALSRPPGHHAEFDRFGGYCYFNNAALAARAILPHGRVAILDIDAHHGNGTQQLFYRSQDVLTVSIHDDPETGYPYLSGFAAEQGEAEGEGYNLNLPVPPGLDGPQYLRLLEAQALSAINRFDPAYLVVAAGVDGYRLDSLSAMALETDDFYRIGASIRSLGKPTVVIQEGGYYTPHLGRNVIALLEGLMSVG